MAMSRANMGQQITKPGQRKKVSTVMREFKEGKLRSGSKKGPVVTNPKQAVAIALSEARAVKKAVGGRIDGCAMRGLTRG